MSLFELVAIGVSQLWANVLRSLLTILGITIGVGAVVGVVSIGEGLRQSIVSQFSQMGGANLIILQPPRSYSVEGGRRVPRTWREYLTAEDLTAMRAEVDRMDSALPVMAWNAQVRFQKASAIGEVQGTLPGYHRAMDWELDRGRFISDWDVREWRRVCVIGDKIAEDLFDRLDPIGQEVKLGGERYTVIGVMKPRVLFGRDWGHQIVVPVTTVQKRVRGNDQYDIIFVYVKAAEDVEPVTLGIRKVLNRLHRHGGEYRLQSGEGILENVEKVTLIMKLVAGGIAGISLMVGGIGIMNIMLVSVTERTREIGIRKALGARQRHILIQFVIEAMVLSLFGGFLGILCGLGLGTGISMLIEHYSKADFPSVVSFEAMGLAVLISGSIGMFFGVYPAARASKLDPVEALRYE
ncbi:MAG: ABC transporter permease [bacterium]|nr:ABC transporter permease [bacterium]